MSDLSLFSLFFKLNKIYLMIKKITDGPGWCGSVDWALAYEPKGCQFDS